jgi:hypothetical protein
MTVRYLLKLLRAALQAAAEEELIERNVGRWSSSAPRPGRRSLLCRFKSPDAP